MHVLVAATRRRSLQACFDLEHRVLADDLNDQARDFPGAIDPARRGKNPVGLDVDDQIADLEEYRLPRRVGRVGVKGPREKCLDRRELPAVIAGIDRRDDGLADEISVEGSEESEPVELFVAV